MRLSYSVLFSVCLLVAAPAFAGDLMLNGGKTSWHSTQCTKPSSPSSILKANPESSGESMNDLVTQHNAYVDAAQAYMNCISNEAATDQTTVNQEIAASAQREIAATQAEINADAQMVQKH